MKHGEMVWLVMQASAINANNHKPIKKMGCIH